VSQADPNRRADHHVTARLPSRTRRAIEQLATAHGRSLSAELRAAIGVHAARATLAYLDTPQGTAGISSGELSRLRVQVEKELRTAEKYAYPAPPRLASLDPQ
jgi:hypothetical protein